MATQSVALPGETSGVTYPVAQQRTRRFTLGEPRSFRISADGSRVAFLRSLSGTDARLCLWTLDIGTGDQRLLFDPTTVQDDGVINDVALDWRERARETAEGIIAFTTDTLLTRIAFTLAGSLWVVNVEDESAARIDLPHPVNFPQFDPSGERIAYCTTTGIRLVEHDLRGWQDRPLVEGEGDDIYWGRAEYAAFESIGRTLGMWWSPDGRSLAVTRVSDADVDTWHSHSPDGPWAEPRRVKYQTPGSRLSDVRLFHVDVATGSAVALESDTPDLPYLVSVRWSDDQTLLALRQSRDHRRAELTSFMTRDGGRELLNVQEAAPWWEKFNGLPYWLTESRLATEPIPFAPTVWGLVLLEQVGDDYAITVDHRRVTPECLVVRGILSVSHHSILFSATFDATSTQVWRWTPERGAEPLTDDGIAYGVEGGGTTVVCTRSMAFDGLRVTVTDALGNAREIESRAVHPGLSLNVHVKKLGSSEIRAGIVLPRSFDPTHKYPVIVASYGGPRAQMVVEARQAWYEPQWFADQGFIVLVSDGRGTSGRGPAWEHQLYQAMPTVVIDDQVDALHAAAELFPAMDLERVGLRGWSFGGYLAATALIRRPDVFHAAVSGAPVTDWRRYVGYYTEAYLGDPSADPEAYDAADALAGAAQLQRPLLLVQGMSDDNVFPFHALRLSSSLLRSGVDHSFLPLSGVSHVTASDSGLERILAAEADFLKVRLDARPTSERSEG